MKIRIQRQSDKVSPFRIKSGRYTASLSTRAEAKRVKQFIDKVLKENDINL